LLVIGLRPAHGQTGGGELERRPAPVIRRRCEGGDNAGDLCNEDADCPGSSCTDRNVFNISVAVHFSATNAQLTTIEELVRAGSEVLFDVTDGQAEIGEASIRNDAFGIADLRVYTATCSSGTNIGNPCNVDNDCPPNPRSPNPGSCGVWWYADTGSWQNGGSMHVSINNVDAAPAPGEILAHEFVHLVFDARDEYHSVLPGCVQVTPQPPASCPDSATIAGGEASCLMDRGGTELCWGHGAPSDLTDISGGNHDATDVTEQSRCRSNRSCWDQVVWSWPSTFLEPAGAPDPAAGGASVNDTEFVRLDLDKRVVLVLDESDSMSNESPSRMERLQVAAKDFVTLAEIGTELGIVSYSNDAETASGRANVAIGSLGANRSTWNDAIDSLSPDSRTNISAGLQKARDMIDNAGGVTANTFIVLMTDGINNEPWPQATADAELESVLNDLRTARIPVYVTCTGTDLGLQSQCSEIAWKTGGFYVDSAGAAQLAEAFVDIHERTSRRESIDSAQGRLLEAGSKKVFVEEDSVSVTFAVIWDHPDAEAEMIIIDPAGNQHRTESMPQGRYARFASPVPGEWEMRIDPLEAVDSDYVARAYSKNRIHSLTAAVRYPTVRPGEEIYVYAYPRSVGGAVSDPEHQITAEVTLPDGSTDAFELHDAGRDPGGGGDDTNDDGIFTGVYRNTELKGAYTFHLRSFIEGWRQSGDRAVRDPTIESARFVREVRISAAVGDPTDVEDEPEDPPPGGEVQGEVQGGCTAYPAARSDAALVTAMGVLGVRAARRLLGSRKKISCHSEG
jgi:Mg-chelatase subunit ChlD